MGRWFPCTQGEGIFYGEVDFDSGPLGGVGQPVMNREFAVQTDPLNAPLNAHKKWLKNWVTFHPQWAAFVGTRTGTLSAIGNNAIVISGIRSDFTGQVSKYVSFDSPLIHSAFTYFINTPIP